MFDRNNLSPENNEREKQLSKTEKELIQFGEKSDNEMTIVKSQEGEETERAHSLKTEVLKSEKLSSDDGELIALILERIEKFIKGPIIIDTFNKDNTSRRAWEGKSLFKSNLQEVVNYYNANKLARNNFIPVQNLIDYLIFSDLVKADTKEELIIIGKDISRIDEKYDKMEVEQKIEAVKDITALAEKLLGRLAISDKD